MPQSQQFTNTVAGYQSQAKRVIEDVARGRPNAQTIASLLESHFKIMAEMVSRIDALERKIDAASSGPGSLGRMGSDD
ncbi:hypothetical protein [Bradyrhizobium arachidis]|uniref:Uncharacterized protein n=1 Tax=Bradyrhizobium arachidis TaxID=858423 RepID=A0AAE7TF98_9BRAD|nr:hypothetical protein [Bradyrhizobium arachidis]QOZ66563.1 hypothetical protein WN72_09380 [Bradyrhizobium arachidis]SFV19632.1 hypothetical protein SAMN05192541_15611 [Bradyrhizobium arachidis]